MDRYCSWCFEESGHELIEKSTVFRDIYKCKNCGNYTLKCMAPGCLNMTQGKPKPGSPRSDSRLKELKAFYYNDFCAVHDGTIPSFKSLRMDLDDIEDYEKLFKRKETDYLKAAKGAALALASGCVVGPAAYIAAPSIASALGATGILGAASTGIAIEGLSGAALTSASLAALGGGTMASGMIFLTAAGAALGAIQGGVIANHYFGRIQDFNIIRYNQGKLGKKPAILFVNGFLSQEKEDVRDWRRHLPERYNDHPWYLVTWESMTKCDLGRAFALDRFGNKAFDYAKKLAQRATRKAGSQLKPMTWLALAADFFDNPFHTAMVKASMTGILLADILSRTKNQEFIIMGHSLGARVALYMLAALSMRRQKIIRDVFLFGGAADRRNRKDWAKAAEAVKGVTHNCWSENDLVLKCLYKGATAFMSDPIGIGPIMFESEKSKNYNFTKVVDSHMTWKAHLGEIFDQIEASSEGKRQGRQKT